VRFARKERITDAALIEAITRAEKGLINGDLSSGLIKQRIARPGQGRSGGFRSIIVYRSGDLAVFLYGFAKSERENIDDDELKTLKEIAGVWLAASQAEIENFVTQEHAKVVSDEHSKKGD
jgi:hypothetical protein